MIGGQDVTSILHRGRKKSARAITGRERREGRRLPTSISTIAKGDTVWDFGSGPDPIGAEFRESNA